MPELTRTSWDEYFFNMAENVASRSTCIRRSVGAVLVNTKHRVLGTGYNGPYSGYPHCTKDTCIRTKLNIPSGSEPHLCVAVHAEMNIIHMLKDTEIEGGTLYCTTQPCCTCLKSFLSCGIYRIVWKDKYNDTVSDILMSTYGDVAPLQVGDYSLWQMTKHSE